MRGLLWAAEIVADKATNAPFPAKARLTSRIIAAGLKRGVFFYPAGTGREGAVVALGPAFIVSEDEINRMLDTLLDAVSEAVGKVAAQ